MLLHIVRNLISCDFKISSNVCFGWNEFLYSNSRVSVSLKFTLVSRILWLENPEPLKIVTSRKSTDASFILQSILMELSWVLNRLMNSVNSSLEWFQMKNISSINLNIASGLHLALHRTSSSKLAINVLAKLGAYFLPMAAPEVLEKPLII